MCTNQHNPISWDITSMLLVETIRQPIDLFYDWLGLFVKLGSEDQEVNWSIQQLESGGIPNCGWPCNANGFT